MPDATPEELRAAREPSGPPPVTLWQVLRGYRIDPLVRWGELRTRYGDVAAYRFAFEDRCFVSHPDGARRVLQDNAGNYTKEHGTYDALRKLLGNGLVTSEGSFWLRQRRLAQPAFHRTRIQAMGAQMTRAAVETAERWESLLASGEEVSMFAEMSRLTLQVVGEALFGTALTRAREVGAAWDVLNTQLTERFNAKRLLPPILPTKYDRDFRAARRTLFGTVDGIIAAKRAAGGEGEDLLSMLMHARDEETGEQMSDRQLRDEVVTMLLAGHETTSVALSWTWGLLDLHPDARVRLQEELARVLGGRAPAASDLGQLTFTRAVIDEAMRLYPPAYILTRRVERDDVVCGYRIRKGRVIVMSPLVFHRHPDFWERPDDFVPERWLDADAEKRRPRFAYMPFSGGPRQCIGNNFATMEAVLILATLSQRFEARLAPGYRLEPTYAVTMKPARGLPVRLARVPTVSTAQVAAR
jgi:cytochrome P450